MPLTNIETLLTDKLAELKANGSLKGREHVITAVIPAADGYGPRYLLQNYQDRPFLRMNSNSYLGLDINPRVINAEAEAAERFGTGPGAVRFISGTFQTHIDLERKLAAFHQREAAMLVSAAYATVMGVLPQLITEQTLVISDALNHNSIINAVRLSRPAFKAVYAHLDMLELDNILRSNQGKVQRVCVITDGIFSMRGDIAPLDRINTICQRYQNAYQQGVIVIVDDSHGVGAFGENGRGTEEYTGSQADILIATLGKAVGVNGGYVVSSATVINYLRETSAFYIYSNPITPAEAAAAIKAITIIDSPTGLHLLGKLRRLTQKLVSGLLELGFETLSGEHPIVPILIRDSDKTSALVRHFFAHNILVTGLNFPVVPKGEQEIRLQLSASHSERDIDYVLRVLADFNG